MEAGNIAVTGEIYKLNLDGTAVKAGSVKPGRR